MTKTENNMKPTRRLILLAGPAAAVFGSVAAMAQEQTYGDLVSACRQALKAHDDYNAAVHLDDDHPALAALGEAEAEGIQFAIVTPARTVADLKAKAALFRKQLPPNMAGDGIWPHADSADHLAWSLCNDILALRGEV